MITITKTDSKNSDFINLVAKLDAYLAITDGEEHSFYDQYNGIEKLQYCIVSYHDQTPVACGAFRFMDSETVEIKRMFVDSDFRNQGIARKMLDSLEKWALEQGAKYCKLETGKRQTEAVQFYPRCGYHQIPNYDPYIGMENSICFEKKLLDS